MVDENLAHDDAEDFGFSKPAGRVRGATAPVGGTLSVRGHRIEFAPNKMAAAMGQQRWEKNLSAIKHVDTVGISPLAFMAGGLKRRLRIVLLDGRKELFTVSRAQRAAEDLQARVERDAASR